MKNDSPNQWRPALLRAAAVGFALLVLAALIAFSPNFRQEHDPGASPFAGDFLQEYLGGYLIWEGDHERFYHLDYAIAMQHDPAVMGITFHRDQWLPIIYPPFYYLLVSPLYLLPFKTAAYVWLGLMALCLAITVVLLVRAHPDHPMLMVWFLPAAMLFAPLLENFASSQKGTPALLILTGTYLLLRRPAPPSLSASGGEGRVREFAAGLVFGLLAFKPQLTLVIGFAMLLKRQWPFVLGGIMTGVVLVGLSLLVGSEACRQYLRISQQMAEYIETPGFQLEKMHCWYGFFKLLLQGRELWLVQAATVLASAVTVALLARLLRGPLQFSTPRFALQFAGLVAGTVLLSPHLLTYDLTILLLPIALLAVNLSALPERRTAAVWLLVLLYASAGVSPALAEITRVQVTVLLLFAWLIATVGVTLRVTQPSRGA